MMNILVTGSKGQLGSEINELSPNYLNYNFFFSDLKELDICDKDAVKNFIVKNEIHTIINCAAYTAVDKAELEREVADKINHLAVEQIARIAKLHGVSLVHISTDYVFDGKGFQPYPTDHPTKPVNRYGETKLKGENALRAIKPMNSLIIRTSWVYSSFGNNFVKTMLRLGAEKDQLDVIYDQVGVPTYAKDLAKFILDCALEVKNEELKIYHYTNEGVCSWYDFARVIMELGSRNCKVNPISTADYSTPAKRPHYSLMDKTSLKRDFSVEIPHWVDSLQNCLSTINSLKN